MGAAIGSVEIIALVLLAAMEAQRCLKESATSSKQKEVIDRSGARKPPVSHVLNTPYLDSHAT